MKNNKNFLLELINIFVQNIKENSTDDFQNYSSKFKELSSVNNFKKLVINTDILDIKILFSTKYSADLFLKKDDYIKYININVTNKNNTCIIDISCSQLDIKGYLQLQIPTIDALEIKSNCADVVAKNNRCLEKVVIVSKLGDIALETLICPVLNLKTISGDIVLKTNIKEFDYELKSKSGDIITNNIKYLKKSHNKIKCMTNTGDIIINRL